MRMSVSNICLRVRQLPSSHGIRFCRSGDTPKRVNYPAPSLLNEPAGCERLLLPGSSGLATDAPNYNRCSFCGLKKKGHEPPLTGLPIPRAPTRGGGDRDDEARERAEIVEAMSWQDHTTGFVSILGSTSD